LWLPQVVIRILGDIRVGRFMKAFPEAIDLMVRGLRSGLPISESINAVAEELKPPISAEFARVSHSIRMGESIDRALWEVTNRIDAPEYKFLIIAMAIQRETGGNLAETLSNLAEILRKRSQLKLKIKALSSEARASAWIIGSLPFLMFGLLLFINYEYMSLLFTDPRGMILIGVGLSMVLTGVVVMFKMVRFEI
jgi:tight adherence protein B